MADFDLSTAQPVAPSGGFDLSTATPVGAQQKAPGAKSSPSLGDWGYSLLSAAARPIAKAVGGLESTFGDPITQGINAVGMPLGMSRQMLPSEFNNYYLNKFTEQPSGVGKIAEAINTGIAGSFLPNPGAAMTRSAAGQDAGLFGPAATQGFVPASQSVRNQVVQNAQTLGLMVDPKVANPSLGNRVLGSLAGPKVAAGVRVANEQAAPQIVNRVLGQEADAALTPESLATIRESAFNSGYVPVRNAGEMTSDATLRGTIDKLIQSQSGNKSFPGLAKDSSVSDTLSALKQDKFDAGDAVDAVRQLRDLASQSFAQGKASAGTAYRTASKAIEDSIERNLAGRGQDGATVLQNFRDARQTIAMAHNVETALSNRGGLMAGLAAQKGVPYSGNLKTLVDFARKFPSAARAPAPSDYDLASQLDLMGGAGTAALTGSPLPLALPFGRMALSQGLLSPAGQGRAVQGAYRGVRPNLAGRVPQFGGFFSSSPAQNQ